MGLNAIFINGKRYAPDKASFLKSDMDYEAKRIRKSGGHAVVRKRHTRVGDHYILYYRLGR